MAKFFGGCCTHSKNLVTIDTEHSGVWLSYMTLMTSNKIKLNNTWVYGHILLLQNYKYADFHVWRPAMKLLWMQINMNVIFDYHMNCSKIENVRQRVDLHFKKWWWPFRKWWYQYAKWNKELNSNFFDTNWSNRESSISKEILSVCFLQD